MRVKEGIMGPNVSVYFGPTIAQHSSKAAKAAKAAKDVVISKCKHSISLSQGTCTYRIVSSREGILNSILEMKVSTN